MEYIVLEAPIFQISYFYWVIIPMLLGHRYRLFQERSPVSLIYVKITVETEQRLKSNG